MTALATLAGCSIDGFEDTSAPITDEERRLTGQIIGESISENQNGMLSSFSEAFAVPSETGLTQGPSLLSTGSFRNLEDYRYSFNADSVSHSASFTLREDTPLLSSATDVELTYTFYDDSGLPIEYPSQKPEQIETVEFHSRQSGEIRTGSKRSNFTRTDQLYITGLMNDSNILTIDGFHTGEGLFSETDSSGVQIEREYILDLNYLNVAINKEVVQTNRNFRNGVNGALSYESTVRDVNGTSGSAKIVNGTVELNGDGTAILNFRERLEPFRLRLEDGGVFDEDEFEGRVTRVNLEEQVFTIANGQRINVNSQTDIDDDDFRSLEEVAAALENGQRIVAEGEYFHPNQDENLWVATEVEFERESSEFEDLIASVNLSENSFTLLNGDQYFITQSSDVEFDDDFGSLQDIANAVEEGLPVEAEGEFSIDPDTGNRLVNEVDFKLEFDEFEDLVDSVNLEAGTFTLEDGREILITGETIIDNESDFVSLEEVSDALSQDVSIEAEGDYYRDLSGSLWIAVEVKFDREDEEDGDDDDDDDDGGDGGEED